MDWKWVSLVFFIAGIACVPLWPYSLNWTIYPMAFCFFVAVLTLLVSIFSKHGGVIWRDRGHS
ncbi:MAG TPA: hypothetical protein VFB14_08510 [Bryobacteraceae bacterium]|nr:hypothetical protein [Bryobacteraceae bacterium]